MVDDRLTARIAELFYINNISQYDIAKKFNFSKSKICRIIKDAKSKKIIQFSIKNFDIRMLEIEKKLEEKYGLREAIVYANHKGEDYDENLIFKGIGLIGAKYTERILENNLNIALSWGRTLYNIFKNINIEKKFKVKIFATLGGIKTGDMETQNNNLVQILSEKIGGATYPIYMPLILKKADYKKILPQKHNIDEILGDASNIDYYFAGLGVIGKKSRMYNPKGEFDQNLITELKKKKICGEIGLNFYDNNGNFINSGLQDRSIYLDIGEIKKAKNIIIAAFGKEKVVPLIGFLKSKITHVLITDLLTAKLLVDSD